MQIMSLFVGMMFFGFSSLVWANDSFRPTRIELKCGPIVGTQFLLEINKSTDADRIVSIMDLSKDTKPVVLTEIKATKDWVLLTTPAGIFLNPGAQMMDQVLIRPVVLKDALKMQQGQKEYDQDAFNLILRNSKSQDRNSDKYYKCYFMAFSHMT